MVKTYRFAVDIWNKMLPSARAFFTCRTLAVRTVLIRFIFNSWRMLDRGWNESGRFIVPFSARVNFSRGRQYRASTRCFAREICARTCVRRTCGIRGTCEESIIGNNAWLRYHGEKYIRVVVASFVSRRIRIFDQSIEDGLIERICFI